MCIRDRAQVDRIVKSIADAGVRNAKRLAQMAQEDTGFGVVSDKVVKNVFASRGVYEHIKDMKTIGELSLIHISSAVTGEGVEQLVRDLHIL